MALITGLFEGGGLICDEGTLINLGKTMVSVLHKELEYKVETLKYMYKKLEVIQPRIKKLRTSSWCVSHPGSVHKKF